MVKLLRRLAIASVIAGAVATVFAWRQARLAGGVPFDRLRIAMNDRVNPLLVQRGIAGGSHAEIATLEHVGRKTGARHVTPVHPTFVEDQVWIPLPYGEQSQWAQNVLVAGHCRLQWHDTVYELDEPQIAPAADDPALPAPAARVAGWLGVAYLRLHVFATREGTTLDAAEDVEVAIEASGSAPVAPPAPVEGEPIPA